MHACNNKKKKINKYKKYACKNFLIKKKNRKKKKKHINYKLRNITRIKYFQH